ncbi:HEPN domain-containing protein [Burkholderia cepacia]|uniref:HEPN domain-containing protein n=1 Tax=Burkholderia cepacia TaxID=292 RepID=UPI0009C0C8CE|nr:HEPN domain-containing protein [Burkholderia cepacia]
MHTTSRDYKFITTFRFLDITEDIEEFELLPGVYLTTHREKIQKLIDSDFRSYAGRIEHAYFKDANHLVYLEDDSYFVKHNFDSNHALTAWLVWVDFLHTDAWLVKDHGMNCEIAYCKRRTFAGDDWSSNFLATHSSVSTGELYKDTSFTFSDLVEWERKSLTVRSYLHKKKSGSLDSFTDKQFSRIGRALRFSSAARRESHPAIKISHYCTAFESLFSTDNAELSHKLSERVAIFLKNADLNPIETYDSMKSFYGIRSKVTHGDSIDSKRSSRLPELSMSCDELLRKAINTIFNNEDLIALFDGDAKSFEDYFKVSLLGRTT